MDYFPGKEKIREGFFPAGKGVSFDAELIALCRGLAELRREVKPDNDNAQMVRGNLERYRKRIFNAMVILPDDASDWQKSLMVRFSGKFGRLKLSLADVEAKSWIVAEEIVKAHERGISVWGKDDLSQRKEADNNIRCSQRMEDVINVLLYNKLVCVDVMDSHQDLLRFISAPNTTRDNKERGRAAYQRHKNAQRAVSPSVHDPAEEPTPGFGRPLAVPQLPYYGQRPSLRTNNFAAALGRQVLSAQRGPYGIEDQANDAGLLRDQVPNAFDPISRPRPYGVAPAIRSSVPDAPFQMLPMPQRTPTAFASSR